MPRNGIVMLGDIAGKVTMLEAACSRWEHCGRYRIARLIAEHGSDMGLPELRTIIAADCRHMESINIYNRCGVHFPQPEIWDDRA